MKTIRMPRVDPAMERGAVVAWVKKEGDDVREGEHILTVMTEKVEFEVRSPADGTLHMILVSEGSEAPVGEALATILETGESSEELRPPEAQEMLRVSPAARKLALEHGIDVAKLKGSGPEGRIVREDVQRAIQEAKGMAAEKVRTIRMSPLRRMIAERMLLSHQSIPQVTLTIDADATRLIEAKKGLDAPYDAMFIKALAKALREHEIFNAALEKDEIRLSEEVNVGFAVATEEGLLVPVVKNVDEKPLKEVCVEVKGLVEKANTGRLSVAEVREGTFTLSNLGMYGIEAFTPIVMPGQVGVLGVGGVGRKVVARGGQLVAQPSVTLSLTFDHRVVDGALAAKFLSRLRQLIEEGAFE